MPPKTQGNMKGTSPSPLIQRGIDQAYGAQNDQSSQNPQEVINKQWNQNPLPPGDTKETPKSS